MLIRLGKREAGDDEGGADLALRCREAEGRSHFFLLTTRTLLQVVREFVLDLREIHSEEFQAELARLSEHFAAADHAGKLRRVFEKGKKRLVAFAADQKRYLLAREREFQEIIDILTQAFITQDNENGEFNRRLLQQSEKMEQITLLDDIKKIKQALRYEVEVLRETVRRKEGADGTRLESLAGQVKELHQELERARQESELDGLTGAYNRRCFDRRLHELVSQNTVRKAAFGLIMLDLDDFKQINDRFGHQTGDGVLVALAGKCRRHIRSEDVLARYGGEEFAIILPGASLKNAIKKANRIREAVSATCYEVESLPGGEKTLQVTVSAGVAAFRPGDSAAAVVGRADAALYAAKRDGKNRVVSEKQLPPE